MTQQASENPRKNWMSFEEACQWVAAQNKFFYSAKEWKKFYRENKSIIPKNIPINPYVAYGQYFFDQGGWRKFLGPRFYSYDQASQWAFDQGIKSQRQWARAISKKSDFVMPRFIPKAPDQVYGDKFKKNGSWAGFLKTNNVSNADKVFWPFEKCMEWVRAQKIQGVDHWFDLRRDQPELFPKEIPSNPHKKYKKEFEEIGGWPGFCYGVSQNNNYCGESFVELCLKLIFADVFGVSPNKKCKVVIDDRSYLVDMMCPKAKLVLEYDGGYFHKDRLSFDIEKTKALQDAGWAVVRVRGTDLDLITKEFDVCLHEKKTSLTDKVEITFRHLAKLTQSGLIVGGDQLVDRIEKRLERLALSDFSKLQDRRWMSYEEASRWAIDNNILSHAQWRRDRKENPSLFPPNLPSNPNLVYTEKWKANNGWYGFLNREIPPARLDHYMKTYRGK